MASPILGSIPATTSLLGYSTYIASLTQTSTGAPTATVRKTDFGATTFTFARTSAGLYTCTANSAVFTASKTIVIFSSPLATLVTYFYVNTSTTAITFTSGLLTAGVSVVTDGLFTNSMIEIRVFD